MKLNKQTLKRIIKEEIDSLLNETMFSPIEIYMDFQRQGGRDYWLSKAYEMPMKYSDYMHADHALKAYIDEVNPSLNDMPQNVWSQITQLINDTV